MTSPLPPSSGALVPFSPSLMQRLTGLIPAFRMPVNLPFRVSLVTMTAGVAALSAVANAVEVNDARQAPQTPPAAQTRLGVAVQKSQQEREKALAEQKRSLALREQAALATEKRLQAELAAREAQAADARQNPATPTDGGGEDGPYDELARIYQTMKPAKASAIFEKLDLDVQTSIARRMRERSLALIMTNMSSDGAVRLSMALAGRRSGKDDER